MVSRLGRFRPGRVVDFMRRGVQNAGHTRLPGAGLTYTPDVTMRRVGLVVMLALAVVAVGLVGLGGPSISCGMGCPESGPERAARDAVYWEYALRGLAQASLYAVGLVLIVLSVVHVRRVLARRRSK